MGMVWYYHNPPSLSSLLLILNAFIPNPSTGKFLLSCPSACRYFYDIRRIFCFQPYGMIRIFFGMIRAAQIFPQLAPRSIRTFSGTVPENLFPPPARPPILVIFAPNSPSPSAVLLHPARIIRKSHIYPRGQFTSRGSSYKPPGISPVLTGIVILCPGKKDPRTIPKYRPGIFPWPDSPCRT